ncbi:MAG: PIN domain-containing protein [bacterium]
MNKSFLIDSNIIVYSIDNTVSWNSLANLVIKGCKFNLYVSIQNIAETYRVITDSKKVANPLQPVDAQTIIFKKIGHLKIIYPNDKTMNDALNLAISKGIVGVDIYDCMLAQVIIENGLDGIITQDIDDFKNHYSFSVIDLQEALNM